MAFPVRVASDLDPNLHIRIVDSNNHVICSFAEGNGKSVAQLVCDLLNEDARKNA